MELTSILIFILSFLRWDFFFKRSPKTRSLARRGRAALTRGDRLSERAPRQNMSANPCKIFQYYNQKLSWNSLSTQFSS